MPMMVQKAVDIARPVVAEQHLSAAQQNIADKSTKESLHNEERVLIIEKTEGEKVDEDGRGGSGHGRDKKKRQRDQLDGDGVSDANTGIDSENRFDISI